MKITDHIKQAGGKPLFSFEIIPPKKGNSIRELYEHIDPLMEFKPPFIDVTTSREEYVYIEKNGLRAINGRSNADYATFRKFELAAAINRLRSLQIKKN